MKPDEFYRRKSAEVKEADIRLVAACMSDHIGEQNAVRLEKLAPIDLPVEATQPTMFEVEQQQTNLSYWGY